LPKGGKIADSTEGLGGEYGEEVEGDGTFGDWG